MTLPECIQRGDKIGPDAYTCHSDRLLHPGWVSSEVCGRCPYVNLPRRNSTGLGDTIHKFTHATGIDVAVRAVVGDCGGCKERKSLANRILPYSSSQPDDVGVCDPLPPGRLPLGEVRRNLMMYIYPIAQFQVWRWNIEQIRKRMHIFNGKRVVTVMTDGRTDSAEAVQRAFGDERIDSWVIGQNDLLRWEMAGLPQMMEYVHSCDPSEITFYCHAKGVQGPEHIDGPTFHEQPRVKWATAMYGACLDDMPFVEKQLETHTFAGAFKRRMVHGARPFRSSWHFSGTFYWFRNARLFAIPQWNRFDQQWFGAETYPGQLVGWGQAAGLFCDRPPVLYLQEAWTGQVDAMWEQWKREHGICTPA
jgi:hypothetical protein